MTNTLHIISLCSSSFTVIIFAGISVMVLMGYWKAEPAATAVYNDIKNTIRTLQYIPEKQIKILNEIISKIDLANQIQIELKNDIKNLIKDINQVPTIHNATLSEFQIQLIHLNSNQNLTIQTFNSKFHYLNDNIGILTQSINKMFNQVNVLSKNTTKKVIDIIEKTPNNILSDAKSFFSFT